MNTTTRRLRAEELETTLRHLDAAESARLDARSDERAGATLARIVSSPTRAAPAGTNTAVGTSRSTAARETRPGVRRVVAVTAVAAAIAVGSVVASDLFPGGQALAWSAKPQALSPARAREAEAACDEHLHGDSHLPPGADLSGLRPVISEARGSLVLVYATDSRPAPSDMTCYVMDGRVVASGGSLATAASAAAVPVAPNSLAGRLGAVYSTSSWSIRGVTGRVGTDVVAVVLDSVAQGPVTATVRDGYFGAWWPDSPTSEAKENAATGPEVTGATVTLRDGSTRHVTVEELSGRTTEELRAPDTGGSASAG